MPGLIDTERILHIAAQLPGEGLAPISRRATPVVPTRVGGYTPAASTGGVTQRLI
jgi:hypothetical protein